MVRTIILAGYFSMMSYLQVTGKLNQYINPRYQYLTIMTMVFALILAIIQLISWVKEDSANNQESDCQHDGHDHGGNSFISKITKYSLVSLPVLVVFLLPTVNLDASIVEAKGFNFPVSKDSTSFGDIEQQYLKPNTHIFFNDNDYETLMKKDMAKYKNQESLEMTDDNYLELMELIYNYPQEFVGRKIKLKGFVYNEPQTNKTFLFRFGILHCVADSGVYGLLLDNGKTQTNHWENNQWITIEGTIDTEFYEPFSQNLPRINVTSAKEIESPSNEYVYRLF